MRLEAQMRIEALIMTLKHAAGSLMLQVGRGKAWERT